jgi:ABC-type hemin transport system substrate-binding protein
MSVSASLAPVEKPKYNTPDKIVRVAQAIVEELETLSSDALIKQQARVKELLFMAAKQTVEVVWSKPGAGASQIVHSVGGAGGKSQGQTSSPHPDRRREGSINSK